MTMRQRKRDLYARLMLGLKIRELLDELDEAADVLLQALATERADELDAQDGKKEQTA